MAAKRPVLVAGATGSVGREVATCLWQKGARVRLFVRPSANVAAFPAGVERAVGDLADRDALRRGLEGAKSAFFIAPHDDAEEEMGAAIIAACVQARVRLVFVGFHAAGAFRAQRWLKRALYGLIMPHYAAKLRISEAVLRSATRPVLLLPGNYYQNDEVCKPEILQGVYPMPLCSFPRVDTRDVGEAAARALLDPSVPPGAYWVVGPKSLSGKETAADWSRALGRQVRYVPDLSGTDALLAARVGGRKAADFQKTYRLLGRFWVPTLASQLRQTAFLLGRRPKSHVDYAREVAPGWLRPG